MRYWRRTDGAHERFTNSESGFITMTGQGLFYGKKISISKSGENAKMEYTHRAKVFSLWTQARLHEGF